MVPHFKRRTDLVNSHGNCGNKNYTKIASRCPAIITYNTKYSNLINNMIEGFRFIPALCFKRSRECKTRRNKVFEITYVIMQTISISIISFFPASSPHESTSQNDSAPGQWTNARPSNQCKIARQQRNKSINLSAPDDANYISPAPDHAHHRISRWML